MAEAKKNYANIENIDTLMGEGVGSLLKNVQITEKKVGDILKRLSSLEQESVKKETQAVEAEKAQSKDAKKEETAISEEKTETSKVKIEEVKAESQKAEKTEQTEKPAAEEKAPAKKKTAKKKTDEVVAPEIEKVEAPVKDEIEKPAQKEDVPKVKEPENKKDVKAETQEVKVAEPVEKAPAVKPEAAEVKPKEPERPSWNRGPVQRREQPQRTEYKPQENRTYNARGERSGFNRGERVERNGSYKSQVGQAGQNGGKFNSARPQGQGAKPSAPRFSSVAPAAPIAPIANGKGHNQPNKKKTYEKTYSEQKKTTSKRALVKQQVSVEDFDEDKSGYRKVRVKKQKTQVVQTIKIEHAVVTTENIPLKVLSEKLGITAVEITKRLFKEGIAKTINDSLDYDTAAYIAADLGIELEYKPEKTAEEILGEIYKSETVDGANLITRPPVVTVMGHVDHGKTSLLDRIRSTNVTAGEAGGITQHIGAYSVTVKGKVITFLDTPGHEAFTAMRARGAQVTDIVILVVAADDGIMPQTVEAINHAKAADVPIIVAVNKIDKPEANIERVKQGLTQNGLVPEEWGGDTILCPVSAKTGEGFDNLLETINLVAEIKELKANPDQKARGIIIEARLDKGRGPVASVLIQDGTLKTGDSIISGTTTGRVRAMIDDKGRTVKSAGPSMAVSILGLEDVPNAGDSIIAVEQDKLLKQVLDERKRKESDAMVKSQSRITLDDVFGKIAEGKVKALNIIVKGDVQGSCEAVKQSLLKLSNDEVKVNVLHSGAGAINETDVMLADSSNAIIVGFNVRPDTKAKALAERSGVDVRSYRIIYELLDDIEKALKGMLAPKYREVMTGKCEVLQTFKITGVGLVAGCYVTEGKLVRSGKLRIYRDDIMIVEGNVNQLKRFKDDVKEVSGGFECGLSIEGFNEIRIGDIVECYITEEIPQ